MESINWLVPTLTRAYSNNGRRHRQELVLAYYSSYYGKKRVLILSDPDLP